jgi:hypothetical protein
VAPGALKGVAEHLAGHCIAAVQLEGSTGFTDGGVVVAQRVRCASQVQAVEGILRSQLNRALKVDPRVAPLAGLLGATACFPFLTGTGQTLTRRNAGLRTPCGAE